MSKVLFFTALFLFSSTALGAEIDTANSVITWTGSK